jgi:hypothetical protein
MKTHTLFRATLIPIAFAALLAAVSAPGQDGSGGRGGFGGGPQGGAPESRGGFGGGRRGGRGGFIQTEIQDTNVFSPDDLRIVGGMLLLPPDQRETAQGTNQPSAENGRRGGPGLFGPRVPATLQNIVSYLRRQHQDRHEEVNFVVAPEINDLRIQNLLLIRDTDLNQQLQALQVASGNLFVVSGLISSPGIPLITLDSSPQFRSSSSEVAVEAFNLSHYSATSYPEGKSREDVLQEAVAALQDAIYQSLNSMNLNVDSLKFFYHPGSGVFVVSGNRDSVAVAKKVALAFCADSQLDKPGASTPVAVQADPRDEKISQLESHLATLEGELARQNAGRAGATNN